MTDVDSIRWNIWLLGPNGSRVKWLGQITDPQTGFDWIKKQGKKATQFVINNVPPEAGRTQYPQRVVQGMPDGSVVQTGEVMMPKALPQRSVPGRARKPIPTRIDNSKVSTNGYGGGAAKGTRTATPKAGPVTHRKAAPKVQVDPAMAKEAAELLEQHKADEAAELAAEAKQSD